MFNHVNYISSTISNRIFTLRKIRSYIDEKTALLLYKTRILSYIDIGDVFYSCCNRASLKKLQKRALRCVFCSKIDTNLVELHEKANVQFLENRMNIYLCAIAHKQEIPQFSLAKPTRANPPSNFKLNHSAPFVNSQCYGKSFLKRGIQL